jgi:polyphosphate glucokinase
MRTLCIDIGGTGIKATILDERAEPQSQPARIVTPRPAVPSAVLKAIDELIAGMGDIDRVSVGFPGVVKDGITKTAPNLDPTWAEFPLAEHLERHLGGKPVRVANDAVIHGLAVVEGRGVELVITLGTGLGSCLFVEGKPGPLELGHHPFRKGHAYEELLGDTPRKTAGNKRWNKRVRRAIAQMEALFNYRVLYIGGGNVRHLERESLPENIKLVENVAGLLGGMRLWQ